MYMNSHSVFLFNKWTKYGTLFDNHNQLWAKSSKLFVLISSIQWCSNCAVPTLRSTITIEISWHTSLLPSVIRNYHQKMIFFVMLSSTTTIRQIIYGEIGIQWDRQSIIYGEIGIQWDRQSRFKIHEFILLMVPTASSAKSTFFVLLDRCKKKCVSSLIIESMIPLSLSFSPLTKSHAWPTHWWWWWWRCDSVRKKRRGWRRRVWIGWNFRE